MSSPEIKHWHISKSDQEQKIQIFTLLYTYLENNSGDELNTRTRAKSKLWALIYTRGGIWIPKLSPKKMFVASKQVGAITRKAISISRIQFAFFIDKSSV